MERLVHVRLQYWLEANKRVNPSQAGFRCHHSTSDQVLRVTQTIFDALEQFPPQRALLALLDFEKAYDRVWREALYTKIGSACPAALSAGRRPSCQIEGQESDSDTHCQRNEFFRKDSHRAVCWRPCTGSCT